MKFLHIGDVHFKLENYKLSQYKQCFEWLFDYIIKEKIDYTLICGDICHLYNQINIPLVENLFWFFKELSKLTQVFLIGGNHDRVLSDLNKKSIIEVVIEELNNSNIKLFQQTQNFSLTEKINIIPFPLEDKNNWSNIKVDNSKINIGLAHQCIKNSVSDLGYILPGELDTDFFKNLGIDFLMVADIHFRQILATKKHKNGKELPWAMYCGSTIAQNYAEEPEKGGLIWEINDKDDWNVYGFNIPNPNPFITLDWQKDASTTLNLSKSYPPTSYFRIRHKEEITHKDKEQVKTELKSGGAKEVVFKSEVEFDYSTIKTKTISTTKSNLYDFETQAKLLKEFLKNKNLSKEDFDFLKSILKSYLQELSNSNKTSTPKWTLKSLKFENLYGYKDNNFINFENFSGMTGIFGRNRSGKSSILGILTFALFSSSDRGAIKNIDILNRRKNKGFVELKICVNGNDYIIKRDIEKKVGKKKTTSLSSISFKHIDENENIIEDFNHTLKNNVEDKIKELIGTREDFFMTAFARQGKMNEFIEEGSTKRKSYLNRFLGLHIFERIFDLAKKDFDEINSQFKKTEDKNWDNEIKELKNKLLTNELSVKQNKSKLETLNKENFELELKINSAGGNKKIYSKQQIEEYEDKIKDLNNEIDKLEKIIKDLSLQKEEKETFLEKIVEVKNKFPLDIVNEKISQQRGLQEVLASIKNKYEIELSKLEHQEKSVSKLKTIPCGDTFPECRFIKDSFKDKSTIETQREKVLNFIKEIDLIKEKIDALKEKKYEEKLNKFNELNKKENDLLVKISNLINKIHAEEKSLSGINSNLENLTKILEEAKNSQETNISDESEKLNKIKNDIKIIEKETDTFIWENGKYENEIKQKEKNKEEYSLLKNKWNLLNMFIDAVGKKGIPLQILYSQIPIINKEISNLLSENIPFNIELEADLESNDLSIYIDDGESKGIVETACGMEKMFASLVLRTALLKVSSGVPNPDFLIIDEGTDNLDDENVGEFYKLFDILKKNFKNVVVITHNKNIKSIADNIIEIKKEKGYSKIFQ